MADRLIPREDPTSPESREERDRAFEGLDAVGVSRDTQCPICLVNFDVNPDDADVDIRHKISMGNRLYSCGCKGTKNRHIFHQYCLANYCSTYLRRNGRGNVAYDWDQQGVPCPICRQPIGVRKPNGEVDTINLIGINMQDRPAPEGGTKRRKKRRRTRRR